MNWNKLFNMEFEHKGSKYSWLPTSSNGVHDEDNLLFSLYRT